jgi:hypothetical protein
MVIYSTVTAFTVKSPAQTLGDHGNMVTSMHYMDRTPLHTFHNAAAIIPSEPNSTINVA